MAEELHFKTGKMGRLARFFAARRAHGDPYDQTLVVPAVVVIFALRFYDLGHVGGWVPIAALFVTSLSSGIWMGACLGMNGQARAMLRGVSVGAIEGAAYAALNANLDRHQALTLALGFIYLNLVSFWFSHLFTAMLADIALITEARWHEGVPRRAFLLKVIRIALKLEKLEGENLAVGLTVFFVQRILPLLMAIWFAYTIFGVSPLQYIRRWFVNS